MMPLNVLVCVAVPRIALIRRDGVLKVNQLHRDKSNKRCKGRNNITYITCQSNGKRYVI